MRAKRSLGQNFLVDQSVISRIVSAAGVRSGDTVVEIGPGRGALTAGLRALASTYVCVEKDDALAAQLAEQFADDPTAYAVNADALVMLPEALPVPGPYRVVANLPYNVGGRITMHLLENWHGHVTSATLMFQREVANRLVAKHGTKAYGALTVLVQSMSEVWPLFGVPPGSFRPIPKVQSRVVRLQPRAEPLWAGMDYEHFRKVVHGGFQSRRKTLLNSLSNAGLGGDADARRAFIADAGLDPGVRPDNVPLAGWVALARALAPDAGSP
jgi:16S rRNA (adenine1518-N6/adenine1519-N6)-dimethyltransferase